MKLALFSKNPVKSRKVDKRWAVLLSSLVVALSPLSALAGSNTQRLNGGSVKIICNNRTGNSIVTFQLNSTVGTIGLLDFDLLFDSATIVNVTTPTQIRASIFGTREIRGLAGSVTTVGQAYGFNNFGIPIGYDIPAFTTVCDNNF
jgi:hypothetical protein